jgi:hypothetical protein
MYPLNFSLAPPPEQERFPDEARAVAWFSYDQNNLFFSLKLPVDLSCM